MSLWLVGVCLTLWLQAGVHAAPMAGSGVGEDDGAVVAWPAGGRIAFVVLRGADGLKLGEAEHRWRHDGTHYDMQTELRTTGLAGLVYDFQYVQHSQGRVLDHGLRPERFRVEQQGRAPEEAHFDWPAGRVSVERRKRTEQFPIAPDDQDVLSAWHLLALRGSNPLPAQITLVTNRRAAQATIEWIGHAQLDLPLGTVDVQHVRLAERSGRLIIDLWVSEAHGHVPLRILITDEKNGVLDQQAVAIELMNGSAPAPQQPGMR